jgi:hypothetical protein
VRRVQSAATIEIVGDATGEQIPGKERPARDQTLLENTTPIPSQSVCGSWKGKIMSPADLSIGQHELSARFTDTHGSLVVLGGWKS